MAAFERLFCGGNSAHYSLMSSLKQEELEYFRQKLDRAREVRRIHQENCALGKEIMKGVAEMEEEVAVRREHLTEMEGRLKVGRMLL